MQPAKGREVSSIALTASCNIQACILLYARHLCELWCPGHEHWRACCGIGIEEDASWEGREPESSSPVSLQFHGEGVFIMKARVAPSLAGLHHAAVISAIVRTVYSLCHVDVTEAKATTMCGVS